MDLLAATFGRRSSLRSGAQYPPLTPPLWEGWLTKAGEAHKSWKNRYARVYAEEVASKGEGAGKAVVDGDAKPKNNASVATTATRSTQPTWILKYYGSDAASAREKGQLRVSDVIAYWQCERGLLGAGADTARPAVFLLLPDRTWTFAFTTLLELTAFVDAVLRPLPRMASPALLQGTTPLEQYNCDVDGVRSSTVVKEGWLNIWWGGMMTMGLAQAARRYCLLLDTGFLMLFRAGPAERLRGFEDVVSIRDAEELRVVEPGASSISNRLINISLGGVGVSGVSGGDASNDDETYGFDVVFDLVATAERKVAATEAAYADSVENARLVQERLDRIHKRGAKIKAALAKKDALSERKRIKAENAYASYVEKLGAAQEELARINTIAADVKARHDSAVQKLNAVGGGSRVEHPGAGRSRVGNAALTVKRFTLLGAEGGGYLLGPRAELSSWLLCLSDVKEGSYGASADSSNKRNEHRRHDSGGGGGRRRKKNDKRRHHRNHEFRNEAEEGEDGESINNNNDSNKNSGKNNHLPASTAESALPEGWAQAESDVPDPQNREKRKPYFFRQSTSEGRSSTWERPTRPAHEWAPKEEVTTASVDGSERRPPNAKESTSGLTSAQNFRRSMPESLDADFEGVAAQDNAKFPEQKTSGSKADAFKEASEWAEGLNVREMLCSVHKISAIVGSERLLSHKMDQDPEVELAKVEKAYRKVIRMLHPDRSAHKVQFSQYEKWLAAALFSIIKEEMTRG